MGNWKLRRILRRDRKEQGIQRKDWKLVGEGSHPVQDNHPGVGRRGKSGVGKLEVGALAGKLGVGVNL